jgi:hypothetical protein
MPPADTTADVNQPKTFGLGSFTERLRLLNAIPP